MNVAQNSPTTERADGVPQREGILSAESLPFVEELYADYLRDPQAVPADWRAYFDRIRDGETGQFRPAADVAFPRRSLFHLAASDGKQPPAATVIENATLQERVDRLLHAYLGRGHIVAHIDPLGQPRSQSPELEPEFYGLSQADLDRQVTVSTARGSEVIP